MTLMIQSWCKGAKCDPCLPVKAGNLYFGCPLAQVHWTTWDWPTLTPIDADITINASGVAASGTLQVSVTLPLCPGGGNSSPTPVAVTSIGQCNNARAVVYLNSSVVAPGGNPFFQYGGFYAPISFYILNSDGTQTPVPYAILS